MKCHIKSRTGAIVLIMLWLAMVGCNLPLSENRSFSLSPKRTPTQQQSTSISFTVHIQQQLPPGSSIFINFIDARPLQPEAAGKYILTADNAVTYSVSLPFQAGTLIKYFYSREGSGIVNEAVNSVVPYAYRLFQVSDSNKIDDYITRWADDDYSVETGTITGVLTNATTGEPVPNILVVGGGEQAVSQEDGTFKLDGLCPGTHNIVFLSQSGEYDIYQQGAVVENGFVTPVTVQLSPTK